MIKKLNIAGALINQEWWDFFTPTIKENIINVLNDVNNRRLSQTIYPEQHKILEAFNFFNPQDIKVVIMGQDPYHNIGQAQGLSFYVPSNIKMPPSLKNIKKEILTEYPTNTTSSDFLDLSLWAKQGVLLLNSFLSVENGKPGSHKKIGWENITNEILSLISKKRKNTVFILWGEFSKSKAHFIEDGNLMLSSAHPSGFSARKGFFGNNHFLDTNDYLIKHKNQSIKWI